VFREFNPCDEGDIRPGRKNKMKKPREYGISPEYAAAGQRHFLRESHVINVDTLGERDCVCGSTAFCSEIFQAKLRAAYTDHA
jgi:hypothetical protein